MYSALERADAELREMEKQGIVKRILGMDENPQRLEDIFKAIDEATKNFQVCGTSIGRDVI